MSKGTKTSKPVINSKALHLIVSGNFKLNEQLKFDVTFQLFVYIDDEGKKQIDIDIVDYQNITFMGMQIERGYEAFKKFQQNFFNMGIDIDSQMMNATLPFQKEHLVPSKFEHVYEFLSKI